MKRLDAISMAEWLLVSQHAYRVRKSYSLDLYGFSSQDRDNSLKITKSLDFEQEYTVAFEIHMHDTPFIIDHFSDSISHLEIFVSEYDRVKPTVVLALIQALPKLRSIEICFKLESRLQEAECPRRLMNPLFRSGNRTRIADSLIQ